MMRGEFKLLTGPDYFDFGTRFGIVLVFTHWCSLTIPKAIQTITFERGSLSISSSGVSTLSVTGKELFTDWAAQDREPVPHMILMV